MKKVKSDARAKVDAEKIRTDNSYLARTARGMLLIPNDRRTDAGPRRCISYEMDGSFYGGEGDVMLKPAALCTDDELAVYLEQLGSHSNDGDAQHPYRDLPVDDIEEMGLDWLIAHEFERFSPQQ